MFGWHRRVCGLDVEKGEFWKLKGTGDLKTPDMIAEKHKKY